MYTSSAISGVLADKLDDLSLKIADLKKEVTKVFPDTKVQTKEKAEELKEKYNITLERVPMNIEDILSQLQGEITAGKENLREGF